MGLWRKKKSYQQDWPAYVPVAERKKKALAHAKSQQKKGKKLNPIVIEGRKIAHSFWGKAWCDHLEEYSDYYNRLPRGRTYVRNGSVVDLQISSGKVNAQVMGSSLYDVMIEVIPMAQEKWQKLVKRCAGKVDSLIELLQGLFSKSVIEAIIEKETGLFPNHKEISMSCSCPDSAGMCKHIAAALYGVGAVLDSKPEWLFTLRNVEPADLIASAHAGSMLTADAAVAHTIEEAELSALFGIEMEGTTPKKNKAVKAETPKAKRGRPKGSTKPKTVKASKVTKKEVLPKAKRGRPKGSAKPKTVKASKVTKKETPTKAKRGHPKGSTKKP